MANMYPNRKRNFVYIGLFSFLSIFLNLNTHAQTQTVVFDQPGNHSFTVPCGVTSITVEAWGGGGAGGGATGNSRSGAGGAGGSYAIKYNLAVTPGTTYNLAVGQGGEGDTGNGENGDDSWFNNTSTLRAMGGEGGEANGRNGNNSADPGEGSTTGNVGDLFYRGGNGYLGNQNRGGAGGGGAGSLQHGGDASNSNPFYGVGGNQLGGNGGTRSGDPDDNHYGTNGEVIGGGGGGAHRDNRNRSGGNGANGAVRISYTGTASYCNTNFSTVEPITKVQFAGINNTTSNTINGTPALEIFCVETIVVRETQYNIRVEGNVNDFYFWGINWTNFTNYFSVYFDWNQDGDFNDVNEDYNIGTIQSSTGVDGIFASLNITIPNTAVLGKTKMRVVKSNDGYPTNPCGNYYGGQAEEYIVNVTGNCTAPTQALANGQAGTVSNPVVVCAGSSVTLTQVGGNAGNGSWVWTKATCNSTAVGSSENVNGSWTFPANEVGTTTYYIHSTCGSACASVTVEVRAAGGISHTSGDQNLEICQGATISTPIVYTATGSPVSIALTGSLPNGVSGNYNGTNKTYTITGTPTASGVFNYTLTVSGNSPCSNTPSTITGSINVLPLPTLTYTENTVTYCTGGQITPNSPMISGGSTASSFSVSPALPTGLGLNTVTGEISGQPTITQSATNYVVSAVTNCGTITRTLSITISSGTTAFNVTPGGTQNVCSDFGGMNIGLAGSLDTIFYQLYRNGVAVGLPVQGTGSAMNFGLQSLPGTYTVSTVGGCETNMNGSTIINITPKPTTQFSYPSYTMCKTGYSDPATITGTPQTGTFSASSPNLVFVDNTTGEIDLDASQTGNYTIFYTIPASGGCGQYIFSRQITLVNSPDYFQVSGGGSICAGSTGVPISLNGSQTNVNYQLYRNGTPVGTPVSGTGSSIDFPTQTIAGTYTVFATLGGCSVEMDYEAIVTVNPTPANIQITPSTATICSGEIVGLTVSGVPPTATSGSTTVSSGNLGLSITNNAQGRFSLLRVTGVPYGATITSVSINFNITHTYDGDLRINLKGPNGNVLNIADRIGGSGNNYLNTTVNNTATNYINTGSAPFTGTYAPQTTTGVAGATAINNNVSNVTTFSSLYDGSAASANGDWILSVRDVSNGDNGTFDNWSITINYTTVSNSVAAVWTPATDLYTNPGATTAYNVGSSVATVYAKPGTTRSYIATVSNGSGCSSADTATINVNAAPVITMTADYCAKAAQNLVVITASSNVNIGASNWVWSNNATNITNAATFSKIEVSTAGTYFVSATASGYPCVGRGEMSIAQELVVNGDFEQGNIGFTSDYDFVPETEQNLGLRDEGTYTVNANPNFNHNNFWGIDHTLANGDGKYMLVNGVPGANKIVWSQTVNVLPNTVYYFSAWAVSLNAVPPFANLIFKVNNVEVGTGTGELPSKPNDNTIGKWKRAYGTWNSYAISGPVTIEIINLQTATNGNDFGLDDISFATLSSFFNLTSAAGTDAQTDLCVGVPITDIEYEAGGDGAAPVLTSGALPPGLETYWNGRTFRIFGTPTASGTFNYTYSIGLGGECGAPRTKSGSITVKPASYPGSFATNPISICYGETGNLTANLTGTVGDTLKWYSSVSGNPGSFSPASPNYTGLTSAAYYVIEAKNGNCPAVKSDTVLVGVKNLWTGQQNGTWTNSFNWSDHQLPNTDCDEVTIPEVDPRQSPVLSTGTATIKNLHILPGGNLEINGDAVLQVSGTITAPTASIDAQDGSLEFNGTATQTISGNWFTGSTLKNLFVSRNLTVGSGATDELKVLGTISFENNTDADLNTGDNIVLPSTFNGTANIGELLPTNDVTGTVTVEKYISTGTIANHHPKSWQFLSVPVTNVSIRNAWQEGGSITPGYGAWLSGPGGTNNGYDVASTLPSLKTFVPNSAEGTWANVPSTSADINNKQGYMVFVRGDRTVQAYNAAPNPTILRAKGNIVRDNKSSLPVAANQFQAVANPYPSAIDFSTVNKNGITQNYFVWDPTLQGHYGVGGYQYISAVDGYHAIPGNIGSGSDANMSGVAPLYNSSDDYRYIQSGQAFFVASTGVSGTIDFAESNKVNSSRLSAKENNIESTPPTAIRTYMLNVINGNRYLADGNLVVFDDQYSDEVDQWDSRKVVNDGENFGLLRHGKTIAVEARGALVAEDTLFYNIAKMRTGTYDIMIVPQNINAPGLTAELIDNFLQTRTPVSLTDTNYVPVSFTSNVASKAADRFMLVFKPGAILPVTFVSIAANRNADRSIAIHWKVANQLNMEQYTVERSADGSNFTGILTVTPRGNNNGGTMSYLQNDLSPLATDNFYRIRALSNNGLVQYSSIVKVAPLHEAASVSVFPNPVQDRKMNISFKNQTKGKVTLRLLNKLGQLMHTETLQLHSSTEVHSIQLPHVIASGIYQLQWVTEKGETGNQQIQID